MNFQTDSKKRLITVPGSRDDVGDASITITSSTTAADLIPAGASGVYRDVTKLVLSNRSGTACLVTILDNSASAKAIKVFLAANGGGADIEFGRPKKQLTAATKWTAQCGTSVDSVEVYAQFVENT
jgi:hypothetical protein